MIVARLLDPRSKLATARGLGEETLASTLGEVLGVEGASEDELYGALDWLVRGQERIEKKLARRHLAEGGLVLWDVTSTYFEGGSCPLARRGYSRDGKPERPQILFGLLTTARGCPVAVEVFPGNTADPKTVGVALQRLRGRFGLSRVVLVGDRGMLTEARISEELRPQGLDWITSLRAPMVRRLARSGVLQLSLLDRQQLAEIRSPDFPGERLIVCQNPLLAEERARKREELLEATERALERIVEATRRPTRPLRGRDRIGVRVGRVLGRYKMGKHFRYAISDDGFSYERDEERIREEAALDGIYVIRTSVSVEELEAEEAVRAYKRLSVVERAFRACKGVDLRVRPIYHWREKRVRAHVFLCMLAYYVEWHLRRELAPLLFDEEDPAGAETARDSVVAPARRSRLTERKVARKRSEAGFALHSFQTLLRDLATLTKNRVQVGEAIFDQITRPTPLQQRAFDLLEVSPRG
jgi:transposase